MCGIAGQVLAPGEAPSSDVLEAMGGAMRHRGPDDAVVTTWGRAGFSFRRLSIVDVQGGAQPIASANGACQTIVNGEIYNHLELREELAARGYRFRSQSDVEVVAHGYAEYGPDIVRRLRGMFAIAIWDTRHERLLLARDRLGQKPLLYWHDGERLTFASEFQALLADSSIPREVDPIAIDEYLTYQYVPGPRTAFRGVRKLLPGHLLLFEKGECAVRPYWTLRFAPTLDIDEREAIEETARLLRDAVRCRRMSDVPLGAFLSGGIDSSTVVAMMASDGPVKTFSVGFEEQDFNELEFARLVAARYGTDHSEFVVQPRAAEVLPRLVRHYGEPYADSSALPTYYLSRMTSDHVKVALSGDGGDELFAGYDRYGLLGTYAALSRVPGCRGLGRAIAGLVGSRLPTRPRRFLGALSTSVEESYARTISYFSPEQKLALLNADTKKVLDGHDAYEYLFDLYAASDAPDLLGRTLHVDTLSYLPEDLLAKVDIATMANSLEGRSPFLDHPLVEFVARLPSRLKRRHWRGKYLLRKIAEELLPAPILVRPKKGFGVPIGRWFRGELKELLNDTLLSSNAASRRYLDPVAVSRLASDHDARRREHGPRLWALLALEVWLREFIDSR